MAAADQEGVDPTLLSVTWRHESSFDPMPFPNPRYVGEKLVGYDVGPLQVSTNYYDKAPFTTGLPKAFTGNWSAFHPNDHPLGWFGKDIRFNGNTDQNLQAGARAFKLDILPRSRSLADAAGLYRAGSRTSPGYTERYNEYMSEADADRAYLNCLRGQK